MTKVNNYLEFKNRVTMGLVEGYSALDKFGENPLVTTTTDPEDVWEDGGTYNFSTTADIVSLSSTAADTQPIKITGLDADWNEVTQTITLTGTTRKALDTPLIRVHRMENEGTTNLAGVVKCYTGTGTAPIAGSALTRAIINNGNNQTLMCIYTVPMGKVAFLYRGEVGMKFTAGPSATDFATFDYLSRRFGQVFKIKKRLSLVTTGDPKYVDERTFPDVIPAKTDIVLRATEVSADMGVWGTFDLLLVDEEKFNSKYLTAIGQPTS